MPKNNAARRIKRFITIEIMNVEKFYQGQHNELNSKEDIFLISAFLTLMLSFFIMIFAIIQ